MTDEDVKTRFRKKSKQRITDPEDLKKLTHEELIDKVIRLEAYNAQLKNLLQKKCEKKEEEKEEEEEEEGEGNVEEGKRNKKKFDFESVAKRHVLLKLYYLGWDCQGYVTQDDTANTIEFHLFKALEKCCLIDKRETSNYHRCGRTDKGVSAFSQVISIDLRSKLPEPNSDNCQDELPYCTMLNRLLPDHIKCYAWSHVDGTVSARFDCTSRVYRYYFPRGDLNVSLMEQGARYLLGEHDFRNFCKMDVGNGVTEFKRCIKSVAIDPCRSDAPESDDYQMLKFVIEGNGFLWHQIRCIMAVLFLVGQGKESPEVVEQLLDVTSYPNKPQYSMANHVPLNLFRCEYEKARVEWNVSDDELLHIITLLQKQWTLHRIKDVMIRDAIDELSKMRRKSSEIRHQAEHLIEGVRTKVYKPLMSRTKCESLESRIEHYFKRRKIEEREEKN